ncbi:probable ATP dependent RNA helicase [Fusarium fujikuroi]|nr:probable ATP dependent RNA helicase [Fusarium fujikuroi]
MLQSHDPRSSIICSQDDCILQDRGEVIFVASQNWVRQDLGQQTDGSLRPKRRSTINQDCFTTAIFALKSAGIKSVGTFDFLNPRREEVYLRGLEDLRAMNLIDENGTITPSGTAAFTLPIDLVWHNAFEEAIKLGCLSELIDIAALVSVKSICLIPPETLHAADVLHEQFMDPLSDHLSELNALRVGNLVSRNIPVAASLEEALELRQKLIQWCKEKLGVSEISFLTPHDKDYHVKIRKAIAKGFVHHAGIKDVSCHQRQYLTLENNPVFLFPRSALGTDWQWVVYHRIETFDYQYMDRCTVVEQDWLLENDYFYPINLPKDDNGKVRVEMLRILFDRMDRPYQP